MADYLNAEADFQGSEKRKTELIDEAREAVVERTADHPASSWHLMTARRSAEAVAAWVAGCRYHLGGHRCQVVPPTQFMCD